MTKLIEFDPNDDTKIVHGGLVLVDEDSPDQDLPYEVFSGDIFSGNFDNLSFAVLVTIPDRLHAGENTIFTLSRTSDGAWAQLYTVAGGVRWRFDDGTTVQNFFTPSNSPADNEATWLFGCSGAGSAEAGIVSGLTRLENTGTNITVYPTGGYDELLIGGWRENGGTVSSMMDGVVHQLIFFTGVPILPWHERRQIYNGADPVEIIEGIGRTVLRNWILNSSIDKKNGATLTTLHGIPDFDTNGGVVYMRNSYGAQHFGCAFSNGASNYYDADLSSTAFQAIWDQDNFSMGGWHSTLNSGVGALTVSDGTVLNREHIKINATNGSQYFFRGGGSFLLSTSNMLSADEANETFYPLHIAKRAIDDREVWAAGNLVNTSSDSADQLGTMDILELHSNGDGTGGFVNSRSARIMIHSPALTPDQISLIHAGADPTQIGTCIAYWSLEGGDLTEQMGLGAGDLVAQGSAAVNATQYVANPQPALRQLTESLRPVWTATGATPEGAGITFDGTAEYMDSPTLFPWFPSGNDWSMVSAWNPNGGPFSLNGVSLSVAQPGDEEGKKNNMRWVGSSPDQNTVIWNVDDGFGSEGSASGGSNWDGGIQNVSVVRSGADIEVSIDGLRSNTTSIIQDPEGAINAVFGADQGTGGSLTAYWKGHLAAFHLWVDEALTNEELGIEEGMLDENIGNVKSTLMPIIRAVNFNKELPADFKRGGFTRSPRMFHFTPPPTAGTPMGKFSRTARPIYRTPDQLLGSTTRGPRMFNFTPPPTAGTPVNKFRRVARPQYRLPSQLPGGGTHRYMKPFIPFLEYCQIWQQSFRIQDDAFNIYELFVGEDGPPDFSATAQPVATSATLPFAWTPTTLPASGAELDLHIVVRRRNAYDLESFNVYERVLTIDSVGAVILGPVTPPTNVAVYEGAATFALILATYISSEDENPADTWEVYAEEGVDPVIGVDAPAFTGLMSFMGEESILQQQVGAYTPGAVLHVLVVAVRAVDSERGVAAVVQFTLPEPLDLVDGNLFGGDQYEQR